MAEVRAGVAPRPILLPPSNNYTKERCIAMAAENQSIARLYFPVLRTIVRHWVGRVTPTEHQILLFINERTLRYGKAAEYIRLSHMTEGIVGSNDQVIVSKLGFKRSAIKKAVVDLDRNNLINTYYEGRGHWQGVKMSLNVELLLSVANDVDVHVGARRRVRTRTKSED